MHKSHFLYLLGTHFLTRPLMVLVYSSHDLSNKRISLGKLVVLWSELLYLTGLYDNVSVSHVLRIDTVQELLVSHHFASEKSKPYLK